MDFRPGGRYLYGLKTPDGGAMWGRFIYREIDAPSRIVLVSSFSDETGGVTRHPMSASWPLEILSVFELESEGDRTTLTIRGVADQIDGGGARDLRGRDGQHDKGLERHLRPARELSPARPPFSEPSNTFVI